MKSARQTARRDPRFWSKTQPRNGCLEWVGYRDRQGYGRLMRKAVQSSPLIAHRYAYTLAVGPIPPGAVVMHTCDNPPCVKPEHLRIGTQADNIHDRDAKGHHRPGRLIGAAHPQAKLTDDDVAEIRRLRRAGVRGRVIAARFGICLSRVYGIGTGHAWTHLEDAA